MTCDAVGEGPIVGSTRSGRSIGEATGSRGHNGIAISRRSNGQPAASLESRFIEIRRAFVRRRATKRVRVAPRNVWGGVSGQWIEGSGRILKEKGLIKRAHAAACEKYGGQMGLLDTVSCVSGRIGRRAYLELSVGAPRVAPE